VHGGADCGRRKRQAEQSTGKAQQQTLKGGFANNDAGASAQS